jgi:hypothetical protein
LQAANEERIVALSELAAIRSQDIDVLVEELESSDGARCWVVSHNVISDF